MNGFSLDPHCSSPATATASLTRCPGPVNRELHSQPFSIGHALHRLRPNVRIRTRPRRGRGHMVWATADQDGFLGKNPFRPRQTDPKPTTLGAGWGCDSGRVTPWGPSNKVLIPSCVPSSGGSLGPNCVVVLRARRPIRADDLRRAHRQGPAVEDLRRSGSPPPISTAHTRPSGWQWAICPTFAECLYSSQRNNLVPTSQLAS